MIDKEIIDTMKQQVLNEHNIHIVDNNTLLRLISEAEKYWGIYLFGGKFSRGEVKVFADHVRYLSKLRMEKENRNNPSARSENQKFSKLMDKIDSMVNVHKRKRIAVFPSVSEMKEGFKF